MPATVADRNRAIRREALRVQLKGQGHVQHVVEIATKLREGYLSLEGTQIQSLKAAADLHCKMIGKYLPDLKAIELTGDDGESIKVDNTYTVKVVRA